MAIEFKNYLPLNLQHFADNPEGNEPPNTDPADPPEGNEPNQDKDKTGTGDDKPEEKLIPQSDVNNLVTRESRAATEKLLKELGVDDFENAKEGMQKFKEWQDSQKTEAERLQGDYKKAQADLQTKESEYQQLQYENAALKSGVNPDAIDDVVALAEKRVTDDVDINQAMKTVIEQYPQFSKAEEQPADDEKPKPHFLGGQHKTNGEGPTDPFAAKLAKWKN